MKKGKNLRRDFLKQATAAGAGVMFVPAAAVRGTAANSALGLGIIGCGGRGTSDGTEFVQNSETRVTALADVFDDRLAAARAHFDKLAAEKGQGQIAAANVFRGGRGYEKLVQSKEVGHRCSSPARPTTTPTTSRRRWRRASTSTSRSRWRPTSTGATACSRRGSRPRAR